MNREEHVQWAKDRANEYLNKGDTSNALASMMSDLQKHPETQEHPAIRLGMQLLMAGHLSSVEQIQKFINGFN